MCFTATVRQQNRGFPLSPGADVTSPTSPSRLRHWTRAWFILSAQTGSGAESDQSLSGATKSPTWKQHFQANSTNGRSSLFRQSRGCHPPSAAFLQLAVTLPRCAAAAQAALQPGRCFAASGGSRRAAHEAWNYLLPPSARTYCQAHSRVCGGPRRNSMSEWAQGALTTCFNFHMSHPHC